MKLVKENIGFTRNINPNKSLRIGKYSREVIEKEKTLFLVIMAQVGMLAHWQETKKGPDFASYLRLGYKLSDKSDRARYNIDGDLAVWCLDVPSDFINKRYDVNEEIEGPFVFISNEFKPSQEIIEAKDADEALKIFLKLEYKDAIEGWDYINVMKRIISILDESEESI